MSTTADRFKPISKYMSYVLRHHPPSTMDDQGYLTVDQLLKMINKQTYDGDQEFTLEDLQELVKTNDKQRFSFDETGEKIRASQGHSVKVDLGLVEQTPPPVLYHGTATKFLSSIMENGLQKLARQHVHLSLDIAMAHKVGRRHGKPVILTVDTVEMQKNGHKFYLSKNNVWLTDNVPPCYINKYEPSAE